MQFLEEIEEYWTNRSDGYSKVNQDELETGQSEKWMKVIIQYLKKRKDEIRILDIGTGPGFFAITLARYGYPVTAIDYTEAMLKEAKYNAKAQKCENLITFHRMDAQNLEFEDNTYDIILSRNLTWNLPSPVEAYSEWKRVLKKGGIMLNFDANWYRHIYDEDKRQEYEKDRKQVEKCGLDDHYTCTDIDKMEEIARKVPLSKLERPSWDVEVLNDIVGFSKVEIETDIWQKVWSHEEKINYASTPMFLVVGTK